jgi:hypothetical protein
MGSHVFDNELFIEEREKIELIVDSFLHYLTRTSKIQFMNF